jgi:hypothetical protein
MNFDALASKDKDDDGEKMVDLLTCCCFLVGLSIFSTTGSKPPRPKVSVNGKGIPTAQVKVLIAGMILCLQVVWIWLCLSAGNGRSP